jgi:hypothetical protein
MRGVFLMGEVLLWRPFPAKKMVDESAETSDVV